MQVDCEDNKEALLSSKSPGTRQPPLGVHVRADGKTVCIAHKLIEAGIGSAESDDRGGKSAEPRSLNGVASTCH